MAVTTNYKMNRFKLQQIYNQKVELNVFSTHFLGVTLDIYLSSPNMNKLFVYSQQSLNNWKWTLETLEQSRSMCWTSF